MSTKQNLRYRILNFFVIFIFKKIKGDLEMKAPPSLRFLLKQQGYSEETVEEIWKWYDFHKRKGAAGF
jgi:hypothetical protein